MLFLRGHIWQALLLNPNVILSICFVLGYPILLITGFLKREYIAYRTYIYLDNLMKKKAVLRTLLLIELLIWGLNIYRGT